jgi:hypothetical protein
MNAHNLYDEVIQISDKLSVVDKVRLLEHLSASLRHDLEVEAYKHLPWEQFIDLTYGSLADDPIERNQPLHPDVRDEIE